MKARLLLVLICLGFVSCASPTFPDDDFPRILPIRKTLPAGTGFRFQVNDAKGNAWSGSPLSFYGFDRACLADVSPGKNYVDVIAGNKPCDTKIVVDAGSWMHASETDITVSK